MESCVEVIFTTMRSGPQKPPMEESLTPPESVRLAAEDLASFSEPLGDGRTTS